jgi:hypothetical protein
VGKHPEKKPNPTCLIPIRSDGVYFDVFTRN